MFLFDHAVICKTVNTYQPIRQQLSVCAWFDNKHNRSNEDYVISV
jgi:hypothetical protein